MLMKNSVDLGHLASSALDLHCLLMRAHNFREIKCMQCLCQVEYGTYQISSLCFST